MRRALLSDMSTQHSFAPRTLLTGGFIACLALVGSACAGSRAMSYDTLKATQMLPDSAVGPRIFREQAATQSETTERYAQTDTGRHNG